MGNKVLFEGPVSKYKPGLRGKRFQERWCQATAYSIMLFKDEYAANCWESKPFFTIPFLFMKSVERVRVVIKSPSRVEENPHQFEIILEDEFSPSSDLTELVESYGNLPLEAEDQCEICLTNISADYFEEFKNIPEIVRRTLSRGKKEAPKRCSHCLEQDFKVFLRRSLAKPIYEYPLESSSPSKWIPSLGGHHTWTNRKIEQARAEAKFLFSCPDEQVADKWVCILNWIRESGL